MLGHARTGVDNRHYFSSWKAAAAFGFHANLGASFPEQVVKRCSYSAEVRYESSEPATSADKTSHFLATGWNWIF